MRLYRDDPDSEDTLVLDPDAAFSSAEEKAKEEMETALRRAEKSERSLQRYAVVSVMMFEICVC